MTDLRTSVIKDKKEVKNSWLTKLVYMAVHGCLILMQKKSKSRLVKLPDKGQRFSKQKVSNETQ